MTKRPVRVVLVGGGHAHLEVIRRAAAFAKAGAGVVLVDPGNFLYSGGASAVLGGSLETSENCVDLGRLCAAHGVERIEARASGLDRPAGVVRLADGSGLPFDLVSFNVGSRVATPPSDEDDAGVYAAKPLADLFRLRADILADDRAETRALVVGGGATGVEIAGNLARLARRHGRRLAVTLLAGGDLLEGAPPRAGRIAALSLAGRGVRIARDARLVAAADGKARLLSGASLDYDRIVFATGLAADPLAARLGLPTGEDGGLLVDETLRSPADRRVFAVGDCASFAARPLPKVGVHGVRAAPVLADNLLAAIEDRCPRPFRPQRTWLWIMDLGDETGLAVRGPFVLGGRGVLRWKRLIDRRFLGRYRVATGG